MKKSTAATTPVASERAPSVRANAFSKRRRRCSTRRACGPSAWTWWSSARASPRPACTGTSRPRTIWSSAFLEQEDAEYWRDWDGVAAQAKGDAEAELRAHLRWIADHILAPRYRGCPFLNVATEFPAPSHPARAVALRNKMELRRRLSVLARNMGARKSDELADQLVLLIDGAYMNGPLLGKKGPVNSLVSAGLALMLAAPRR
jgi:hypothetical protein